MSKIEYSQPLGVTEEANIMKINFSNALRAFEGNSIVVSRKFEQDSFREFIRLLNKWKRETLFVSSGTEIITNSAYLDIISKGPEVLPWIIRDLKESNNHWFVALEALTGDNPISDDHIGNIPEMKNDWLNWAKSHNVLE